MISRALLGVIGICVLSYTATPVLGASFGKEAKAARTAAASAKGVRHGLASYYGRGFQGKKTAAGEVFDKNEMVAAHPSYPMGTRVRVTNLKNGRTQEVVIIDRGPAEKQRARGVIIDVSERAASQLGFRQQGRTRVRTEVVDWGAKKSG